MIKIHWGYCKEIKDFNERYKELEDTIYKREDIIKGLEVNIASHNKRYTDLLNTHVGETLVHRTELEKLKKQLCNLELYNNELESKLLIYKKYESDTLKSNAETQNYRQLTPETVAEIDKVLKESVENQSLDMDELVKILLSFSNEHFSGELGFTYRDYSRGDVHFMYTSREYSKTLASIPAWCLLFNRRGTQEILASMKPSLLEYIQRIKANRAVQNVPE